MQGVKCAAWSKKRAENGLSEDPDYSNSMEIVLCLVH